MSQLAVIVNGRTLPDEEARAVWSRFSAHMDQHRGDFTGFAVSEGYASAAVAIAGGAPTLTLTSEADQPVGADESPEDSAKGTEKRAAAPSDKSGRKQGRARAHPDDGRGGSRPPRRKR